MRLTRLFAVALVAAVALIAAPRADAVTFTFADPGSLFPTSASTGCFNGDDRCGTTLSWTVDSLGVTASSPGTDKAIIQDRHPNKGGLGVVNEFESGSFSGHDEVNTGETLVLTFAQSVFLNTVTFFDEDHHGEGHTDYLLGGKKFDFAVGFGAFSPRLFSATDFEGIEGTFFSFRYGGTMPEDFYVATLDVDPVPEPATLLLLGSGLTGLVLRRRQRQ